MRKYQLKLTDLETGDIFECENILFVLIDVLATMNTCDPAIILFLRQHLDTLTVEKIIAWHVCKILPDTGNSEWQAPQYEIEKLSKLIKE